MYSPCTHSVFVQQFRHISSAKRRAEVEKYLERQASDKYSKLAKEHSYRARSAFKLLQINEKLRFIKPGRVAIDAGAAPGSWCQVLSHLMFPEKFGAENTENCHRQQSSSSYILGIDLLPIERIPNVDLLCNADFTRTATQAEVRRRLGPRKVDLLLSDMAPNPTGAASIDHIRILDLCRSLLKFGTSPREDPILAEGGVFLCKIFDGTYRGEFVGELKAHFRSVRPMKPDASRDASSELYLFAAGFQGTQTQKRDC